MSAYRATPDFTKLAPKSRRDYGRILDHLLRQLGAIPAADLDREVVYAIRDSFADAAHGQLHRARPAPLLSWAMDRGRIRENPAARPKQLRIASRRQVWSAAAEARFLEVASPSMVLAYVLHAFTAQRQGDILAMTWHQYSGGRIRLRQAKTVLVDVPVHRDLQRARSGAAGIDAHPDRRARAAVEG